MSDMDRVLIELKGVSKAYQTPAGDFYALDGIDLQVRQGEFVAVVGKSGAGKSTLINMITGIDRPTAGAIEVGSRPIHRMSEDDVAAWRGRHVGVVFQSFQLLPMLTCAQNVMLPMDFAGLYGSLRERRQRALHLLERVGLEDQADKLPSEVSGGQRQRVAIARALANDPMLVAADEPTGNLDSRTADAVFEALEQLVAEGKTILMVTHDRELAARTLRVIHLTDGKISTVNGFGERIERMGVHAGAPLQLEGLSTDRFAALTTCLGNGLNGSPIRNRQSAIRNRQSD